MNILPKKRWHVRNKDNIARVRKDQAEAEEIKRRLLNQQQIAESEVRVNFLRKQKGIPETKSQNNTIFLEKNEKISKNANECQQGHLNLFNNLQSHIKIANAEHEIEKKTEKEKYEKQIGYLTYLGQDSNEALKLKNWYEMLPERTVNSKTQEKDAKNKHKHDPLSLINSFLPIHNRTHSMSSITGSKTSFISKSTEIIAKSNAIHDFSTSQKVGKKQYAKHSKGKLKHTIHKNKHKSFESDEHEILGQKRLRLETLRKERLKREVLEKERQSELLKSKTCRSNLEPRNLSLNTTRINQKYNSQYNPQLAKQNMN